MHPIHPIAGPRHSAERISSRRAFTLTELLTVIAIIGVLAAIIFPVVGKMRAASQKAACASNLRQIGIALNAFIADHKGALPGYEKIPWESGGKIYETYGLASSAGATYYLTNGRPTTGLASQLMPYMDFALRTGGGTVWGLNTAFLCPANPSQPANATDTKYAANYYLAPTVRTDAGITKLPFGNSTANTRALIYAQISNPGKAPAVFDIDVALLGMFGVAASTTNPPPDTSVHGSTRNVLYFDGHVAAVSADVNPLEKL